MALLFNRHFTPDDLRRLTGTMDQLAGVRLVEYADGKARGLRAAEVWTGSGFRYPRADEAGYVTASIVNRPLDFGAFVRYRAAQLPALAQWKMMGAGDYVCALEPATNHETPRAKLREQGRLKMLVPGEQVNYVLEMGANTAAKS